MLYVYSSLYVIGYLKRYCLNNFLFKIKKFTIIYISSFFFQKPLKGFKMKLVTIVQTLR